MTYPGHSMGRSYPFAEIQLVYSTAPAEWAELKFGFRIWTENHINMKRKRNEKITYCFMKKDIFILMSSFHGYLFLFLYLVIFFTFRQKWQHKILKYKIYCWTLIINMKLKCSGWWDSTSGNLGSGKSSPFFAIIPRSTLTWTGRTS